MWFKVRKYKKEDVETVLATTSSSHSPTFQRATLPSRLISTGFQCVGSHWYLLFVEGLLLMTFLEFLL